MPETPSALLEAFDARMRPTGAGEWVLNQRQPQNGDVVYASRETELIIGLAAQGGLVTQATLYIPKATPAEIVRLETAAAFLAARIARVPETQFRREVASNVGRTAEDRERRSSRFNDEAVLTYASPNFGEVTVVITRLRCD